MFFTVGGILVESVDVFDTGVLVQEVDSGASYTIEFNDIDPPVQVPENSNVISLKGWLLCQKTEKKPKKTKTRRQVPRRQQIR